MYINAQFVTKLNDIKVSHTTQVEKETPLENMAHVVAGFTGKSGIWFEPVVGDAYRFIVYSGSERIGQVFFSAPIYLSPAELFI